MDELFFVGIAIVVPLAIIAGGVAIILAGMYQRTRSLEMAHRERMAMIERGLMPSPERDPARFEHPMAPRYSPGAPPRYRSLGVALIGLGLGLMLIIGAAGGAPGPAIGVGGAIAILGAAFIVNGYLQRGAHAPDPRFLSPPAAPSPSRPLGPSDPPGPVAP
jgi:hypothetical protein